MGSESKAVDPARVKRTTRLEISSVEEKRGDDSLINRPDRIRLGEWLVSRELITRYHLYQALNMVYKDSHRIGDALVRLGHIPRDRIESEALALAQVNASEPRAPYKGGAPSKPLPRKRPKPPPVPKDA